MDYNQSQYNEPNINKPSGFAIASLICGIASIVACCTGFFSIIFGALGVLFAILTRRRGQSMSTMSLAGLVLSGFGLALGLFLTVYAFIIVFTDPNYMEQLDMTFQQMYGMSMDEYMQLYQ